MCVHLRELTGRSKWCPISYLSAPGVYLPGYIIICWPSHMIWEREVQNPRHPREPSQDVMRDTGLWPNTLSEPHIWAQALAQYDLLLALSLSNLCFSPYPQRSLSFLFLRLLSPSAVLFFNPRSSLLLRFCLLTMKLMPANSNWQYFAAGWVSAAE